jgi:hypothetical protein
LPTLRPRQSGSFALPEMRTTETPPTPDKPKGVDWSWPGRIMLAKMPNTFAGIFKIMPGES